MGAQRVRLVAGNWKMNGTRKTIKPLVEQIIRGVGDSVSAQVALCPPFVYLPLVAEQLAGTAIALGAQNVSAEEFGAYTGEVSAHMLKDYNCRYAIVGHSERRVLFGESDSDVAARFIRAVALGLTPVLCVGESLAERDDGCTEQVVEQQLQAVIGAAGVQTFRSAVVAYEPVWAIGTGKTAAPGQAQDAHAFIRQKVATQDAAVASGLRILYGGSVKAANAAALFAMPDIDGALVGGASLDSEEFLAICRAA